MKTGRRAGAVASRPHAATGAVSTRWRLAAGLLVLAGMCAGCAPGGRAQHAQSLSPSQIDVFVVAHADDWQLFIGDRVLDRPAERRAVFIYVTAGDDGREEGYWQARERAALGSLQLALDQSSPQASIVESGTWECGSEAIAGKSVHRCQQGNTQSYFLRLPDGNGDGNGFPQHEHHSLARLLPDCTEGCLPSILTIDRSSSYTWRELQATLRAIIQAESQQERGSQVVVFAHDPDADINQHDHPDHLAVGRLAEEVVRGTVWNQVWFLGYVSRWLPVNLTNRAAMHKAGVFMVYERRLLLDTGHSTYGAHPQFYSPFFNRTYVRTVSHH